MVSTWVISPKPHSFRTASTSSSCFFVSSIPSPSTVSEIFGPRKGSSKGGSMGKWNTKMDTAAPTSSSTSRRGISSRTGFFPDFCFSLQLGQTFAFLGISA